ncbi:protein-disulfide reductase DsbD [Methylotenera sp. N17]|uniref:protein-disulfide reductase DsbD n=1 Tax=Methylotenera sp. N17 TaxID=1502761 RepID=UPI000645F774|nr:protein-disulfide reductase DsbD [Methylotenera sp. N17]
MLRVLITLISFWTITLLSPMSVAGNTSSAIKNLFTEETSEDDFLSPDIAFQVTIAPTDAQTLQANFKVEPGYYLYKQRIKLNVESPETALITAMDLPAGEIKDDPNFGKQEVYHHDFSTKVGVSSTENLAVKVTYQGCSEKGLCYAPQTKTFTFGVVNDASAATPNPIGAEPIVESGDDSQASNLLKSGHWWLIILGFFGAGLLLAFTPCVFPMIPILSSMIIGKNAHVSRLHAFNLSLAYTLGMCLTYTLLGIAAGLSGQLLSNALQTPWALSFGAIVFVLLALSMFGFYELKLPSHLENSIFNLSNRIKGGQFFGDFLMGVLSALIISPCVAAPLAGALLYISKTHDVVLGGVALFSLSLGMGFPLLLIGASAGTLLPRVGAWMNAVRQLFGVLMLGVAVWLIGPIIPMNLQLALWAALLIVPAIYMHALDNLPGDAKPILKLWKGVAIMMLITGIALLIGALSGAKSPLQPLSGVLANTNASSAQHALNFKRVRSVAELDQAIQAAKGQYVMFDFYADWCVSCKEYEQFVFTDPRVQAKLKQAVLLQADVTANNADDAALLKRFALFGPPGILFFNQDGKKNSAQVIGYKNADEFLAILNTVQP